MELIWFGIQCSLRTRAVVLPVVYETPFTRSPATPRSCFPAGVAQAACPLILEGSFSQILPIPRRSPLIADLAPSFLSCPDLNQRFQYWRLVSHGNACLRTGSSPCSCDPNQTEMWVCVCLAGWDSSHRAFGSFWWHDCHLKRDLS